MAHQFLHHLSNLSLKNYYTIMHSGAKIIVLSIPSSIFKGMAEDHQSAIFQDVLPILKLEKRLLKNRPHRVLTSPQEPRFVSL